MSAITSLPLKRNSCWRLFTAKMPLVRWEWKSILAVRVRWLYSRLTVDEFPAVRRQFSGADRHERHVHTQEALTAPFSKQFAGFCVRWR